MSASDTGEEAPFVHLRSSVPNIARASSPASRTVCFRSEASVARLASSGCSSSPSAKRQPFDAHGRRSDAVAEFQIARGRHRLEDFEQMAGDCNLADGVGDLAILDPEAGRAPAVVAGHAVDAGADQVGDVEALLD